MSDNAGQQKNILLRMFLHPTVKQLFRYGLTTGISYLFILGCMYIAVDIFGFNKRYSYAVINAINYIGVYIAYSKFVFKNAINRATLLRFIAFLGVSWVVSYLFFWALDKIFNLHYALIVVLNTIILGSMRFFANKRLVFKK